MAAVSTVTLLGWIYGGDYPARAMVETDNNLYVWSESGNGGMETHIWRLNEDHEVVVEVEMYDDEELNTDPYNGHMADGGYEIIKDTSFEDFMKQVKF